MVLSCLLTGTLNSPLLAQDSLQVTFVGDRELELREVTKPHSNPQRVDLGLEKPTISYAPCRQIDFAKNRNRRHPTLGR